MRLKVDKSLPMLAEEAILELIRREKLKPGAQLPTESQLVKLLQVGRSTLREALANLTKQGVLHKVQGKGTFIRQVPIVMKNGLDQLFSVTENIVSVGATPSTSRIHIKIFEAEPHLAEKLQIIPEERCYWVERVRRADEEIAAYCLDILPIKFLSPQLREEDFHGSLFDLLAEHGHLISHAESNILPTTLTQEELPELQVDRALFLFFEEIYYNTQGIPVIYSNDYYSAEIFDFKMIRRRNL